MLLMIEPIAVNDDMLYHFQRLRDNENILRTASSSINASQNAINTLRHEVHRMVDDSHRCARAELDAKLKALYVKQSEISNFRKRYEGVIDEFDESFKILIGFMHDLEDLRQVF
jgi:hypothetical protein